ncbi:MAG: PorT family protein, partial [Muribaculaceae bacterium]|nr:PorT family protein [Muribaculaceae bacterium]
MRRLILSLLVALGVASGAVGQRYYSPDLTVGVKAGATLSRMQFMPTVRQSMTSGGTAGIMVRYSEEKLFGLLGELNLTQRGWAEDFRGADFRYSRHFTYLQLPLLTQIRFGWEKVKIFVNLGPEAGYMIGSKVKSDFDYRNTASVSGFPSGRHTEQLDMKVSNRFDYGIAGGLGVEFFCTPRNSIIVEGRFYYGIGNVFPASR